MEKHNILNLDQYPLAKGVFYGGHAGRKKAILIDGNIWLVKYPQNTKNRDTIAVSYTTSPLSEYIGSHVYEMLGIPVHETRLGISEGKTAVACRDFTNGIIREYDMNEFQNMSLGARADEKRDSLRSASSEKEHGVEIEELLYTLDHNPEAGSAFKERFWNMFVVDGFISNSERHNGNWGILSIPGKGIELAPVYDNGNCLLAKHSEEKFEQLLKDVQKYNSVLNSGNSPFFRNGHHIDYLKTIRDLGFGRQEKNPELIQAVKAIVPKIIETLPSINAFIETIPETFENHPIITESMKKVYKNILTDRTRLIFEPALQKARNLEKEKQKQKQIHRELDMSR